MNLELQKFLCNALQNKNSITVPIVDIERFAGDDWLLEICAQAQHLKVRVNPRPGDVLLELTKQE